MFLQKIVFRNTLLCGWVEIFVAFYWCRWKVQDMTVRVVFFILKLVRKFSRDGELNTAWNREKIAMSQGFARYWVTLLRSPGQLRGGWSRNLDCLKLTEILSTLASTSFLTRLYFCSLHHHPSVQNANYEQKMIAYKLIRQPYESTIFNFVLLDRFDLIKV